MPRFLIACLLALLFSGCGAIPRGAFSPNAAPLPPDYRQDRYWAALPWRQDEADLTPDGLAGRQAEAPVDVFFLHPTTYLVGIRVEGNDFQHIAPCRDSLDTGCFTAWRTFKRGYEPKSGIRL